MKRTKIGQRRFDEIQREMAAADRATDRIVAARFQSFLMSDSKWLRVLTFLEEQGADQQPTRWKFVDAEDVVESRIFCLADRGFQFRHGVAAYRHIEWIEVVSAEADDILRGLEKRGLFEIERTTDGFKLFGYK